MMRTAVSLVSGFVLGVVVILVFGHTWLALAVFLPCAVAMAVLVAVAERWLALDTRR